MSWLTVTAATMTGIVWAWLLLYVWALVLGRRKEQLAALPPHIADQSQKAPGRPDEQRHCDPQGPHDELTATLEYHDRRAV